MEYSSPDEYCDIRAKTASVLNITDCSMPFGKNYNHANVQMHSVVIMQYLIIL